MILSPSAASGLPRDGDRRAQQQISYSQVSLVVTASLDEMAVMISGK
jgi:hypothetical protein